MTPAIPSDFPHKDRGTPNCYIGFDKHGDTVIKDQWGNTQCTNCYKHHANGYAHQGCHECGGPRRSEDELDEIRAFNIVKWGKLAYDEPR